jgi:putative MATE family efflux protein
VPALGTLAAEPLYLLADSAIVGRLGAAALASIGLAYAVLTFPFWITAFIQRAITTQTARSTGGNAIEQSAAADMLADGLGVASILGIGLAVVLWLGARPLSYALNGRGDVLDGAVRYLQIGVWGMPFLLLSFVGHGLLQGSGRTSRSLMVVVVANVVNVILELWFVHGLHWGLAGSAWGTVVAQAITATWLMWFVVQERRKQHGHANQRRMIQMVVDGLRFGVRTACIAGTFMFATAAATRMGAVPAAAHQIVSQLFYLSALALDALALAGQVLVAEHLGADDGGSAATIRKLVAITFWFGCAVAAVFIATSGVLPRLFTPEGPVRSAAIPAVLLLGLMSIPGAIAFLYDGVFVGTGDITHMVRSAITATLLFIPFGVACIVRPSAGLPLLWSGLLCWMIARAWFHHRKAVAFGWLTKP